MKRSVIKGTGRYLPSRCVTNDDLSKMMDTNDEWIQQRTGIKTRYWIPEGETVGTSDLALEASKKALDNAGWKPEDIDLIIFATLSPDIFFPGAGCFLQTKLGLTETPALDIRQQCTGFLYAMSTADAYIRSGMYNKVLVVGAEVHSTGLDKTTAGRDVAVLFGDGAGAVCLEGIETDKNVGIISTILKADGQYAEKLKLELPASKYPERINAELLKTGGQYPTMDGTRIFKLALRKLPEITHEVLGKAEMTLDDIDMVIPHQANLRINEAYLKTLGIPAEKMFNNIQKYGNTTAATIPIALDETIEQGLVDPKSSTVLLSALGAGLTWAAMIYRFGE
ncbi:3-oxoacyl-ACP synthase III family protein [Desulfoluna sp.]|uniref:3-oxoacyl-ACP synthase III family protein n=1 Tax=Desulfoluna sp. TaxID=2045199 RepID=UPI00262EFFEB|nr:beta-ketoacyl-ACP synthase III [Desulfoluna sp.]